MVNDLALRLGVLFTASLLSAFFSAAETALFSLRSEELERENVQGSKVFGIITKLRGRPEHLLTTIVLANMVFNLLFFSVSYLLIYQYRSSLSYFMVSAVSAGSLLFLIVFCEVIPKNLSVAYAKPFSVLAAYPLFILQKILWPILLPAEKLTSAFSNSAVRLLPEQPSLHQMELRTLIELSEREGVVEEDVAEMIAEVLELSDISIREILIPRVDMVCFEKGTSAEEIKNIFKESKHTLLPVYEGRMDNMLGVIHLRDFIFADEADFDVRCIIRKIPFMPESASAEVALYNMRDKQCRMVFVVDEYGALEGVLTIEDIIEEVVGNIKDEFDEVEIPTVNKINESE